LHALTCRTLTAGARADLHRARQNAPALMVPIAKPSSKPVPN
jgi:hypothetical protein